MTEFLLRHFAREQEEGKQHAAVGRLAGVTGIVCNVLLTLAKLTAGLLAGSVAAVADAMNSLSDAASSLVTLFGFRLARRPADRDHPYGHARYEYLTGTVIAALILLIGAELAVSSVRKILRPEPVDVSWPLALVLLVSAAAKLWLSAFYAHLGRRITSQTLLASAADSRNDVLATAAVLLGCLCNALFHVNVDAYAGLLVAVFILVSGLKIAREAVSPLLGKRVDQGLMDAISGVILSNAKVLGMHDLLVHDYGPGCCYASVHVELSAREDLLGCHGIIDEIEREVRDKTGVQLVAHCDPVVENDAEREELLHLLEEILREIHPQLSVHDFRLLRGGERPELVFDLSVPYALLPQSETFRSLIHDALRRRGKDCTTTICFDGK